MTDSGEDVRIRRKRSLIAPAVLAEDIPLTQEHGATIHAARREIAAIVHRRDPRLLVVVGPCSIHDPDAAKAYADRLAPLAAATAEKLRIVMRVYFEKPRSTVGWKGYINDPALDGSFKVNDGLRRARELLAHITGCGLPVATEFLDTTFGQYYADFVSWGAIGARTVESQIHRQLASGLSMPVGIKNRTDGDIGVALDALIAARASHLFPTLTKEGAPALYETSGNADAHLVLRGGTTPNYDRESVALARSALAQRGIDAGIVIDCSHANSAKDHTRQAAVASDVDEQRRRGESIIVGLMLESHLVAGRQDRPETYGQSITDACIGWAETERVVNTLAS